MLSSEPESTTILFTIYEDILLTAISNDLIALIKLRSHTYKAALAVQ